VRDSREACDDYAEVIFHIFKPRMLSRSLLRFPANFVRTSDISLIKTPWRSFQTNKVTFGDKNSTPKKSKEKIAQEKKKAESKLSGVPKDTPEASKQGATKEADAAGGKKKK